MKYFDRKSLKLTLFFLLVILSALLFLTFAGHSTEVWDGYCSYKKEFGIVPYIRIDAGPGLAEHCKNGLVFPGFLYLIGLLLSTIFVNTFTWIKFFGKASKDNH
jgi:hypothetical protein